MAVERHGRKAIYTKAFNEAFTRVARHKGHTYFDDRARNASAFMAQRPTRLSSSDVA